MGAAEALSLGIVDQVVASDLMAEAIAIARNLVGQRLRRTGALAVPPMDAEAFEQAASKALSRTRGQQAPIEAVRLVRSAGQYSLLEGWQKSARRSCGCAIPTRPRRCATCSSPSARRPRWPGSKASWRGGRDDRRRRNRADGFGHRGRGTRCRLSRHRRRADRRSRRQGTRAHRRAARSRGKIRPSRPGRPHRAARPSRGYRQMPRNWPTPTW